MKNSTTLLCMEELTYIHILAAGGEVWSHKKT